MMLPPDSRAIAEAIASWAESAEVSRVYFFGSRVRGDHRPDSDIDLAIDLDDIGSTEAGGMWWMHVNATFFEDLKVRLNPIRLEVRRSDDRGVEWPFIRQAAKTPALIIGKCICLVAPPK